MRITTIICLLFSCVFLHAQDTIYLSNPSFEDTPRRGGNGFMMNIDGWFDCGKIQFKGESPPDIHPTRDGAWEVQKYAMDGDTYLGMVVRDNDSWEALSQKLSSPLLAGTCYSFSILLSRSQRYVSHSQMTKQEANYDRPTVLRIWGANKFCGRYRLLAQSETVNNDQWRQFNFKFEPKDNFSYVVIEAYYKTPVLVPYNGHILIDGASDIVPIPCETVIEHEPILLQQSLDLIADAEETITKPTKKPSKADFKSPKPNIGVAENQAKPKPPVVKETPKPKENPIQVQAEEEKTIAGVSRQKMTAGQTILVEKIYFEANASEISKDSYPELNFISYFLEDNVDIVVEVQGHTNGTRGITHSFCDELSTNRARAVAKYFADKGIDPDRLKYKGYGKRKPIATNRTAEGRKRNQRVEIKILSIKN